jgi:hypothetical protein
MNMSASNTVKVNLECDKKFVIGREPCVELGWPAGAMPLPRLQSSSKYTLIFSGGKV